MIRSGMGEVACSLLRLKYHLSSVSSVARRLVHTLRMYMYMYMYKYDTCPYFCKAFELKLHKKPLDQLYGGAFPSSQLSTALSLRSSEYERVHIPRLLGK